MATEKKVYDYAPERVRDQLLDVFRKRRGEATTADLVAQTGLPTVQVETEIKAVSDEYGARLRVTESGESALFLPRRPQEPLSGIRPRLPAGLEGLQEGCRARRRRAVQGLDRRDARRLFPAFRRARAAGHARLGGGIDVGQLAGQPQRQGRRRPGRFRRHDDLRCHHPDLVLFRAVQGPLPAAIRARRQGRSPEAIAGLSTRPSSPSSSATAIRISAGTRWRRRQWWPSCRRTRV